MPLIILRYCILLVLLCTSVFSFAQPKLHLKGTRSWIKASWDISGSDSFKVYISEINKKPAQATEILSVEKQNYYFQNVSPETSYYVWVEAWKNNKLMQTTYGSVKTRKAWSLNPSEVKELQLNPSSAAVPSGMELYWQDEFNDILLNRNKWTTNYFSSLNYLSDISRKEMETGTLPQPAYVLNGSTINLYVSDSLPNRLYLPTGSQKISSIQTYDWHTNENHLDNSRGGYFEVKVKRSKSGTPKGTNTAFWLDAPGPNLKYYLEKGTTLDGIEGIRPRGQAFEIDVFEELGAQFVLHGNVDKNGKFEHNLATHITTGFQHENLWHTHGVLWTPTSIKHYIDGQLMGEYSDKHKIFSPNHFMNVFLGTYGSQGEVHMEVDYIRYYTWPFKNGNELPNPDFEEAQGLNPWEGSGQILTKIGRKKSKAVLLMPGEKIEQYIYLNNSSHYQLRYWNKGKVKVTVNKVKEVTGELSLIKDFETKSMRVLKKNALNFNTEADYEQNLKTVQLVFMNSSNDPVVLDDITIKKK